MVTTYTKTIVIPRKMADEIDHLLANEPASEDECFGEDLAIINTCKFPTGIEMDIKLCGVQYKEGDSNLPWTEAVLFKNGSEVDCSEVFDEYFGGWQLEYDGITYVCIVEKGDE